MASIMQGTTPAITISISPDDFSLSAATKIELYVKNGDAVTTYTAQDLVVDTEANTITRQFTEAETAAMNPAKFLTVQARFWFGTEVVGINKITFSVSDMIGVGADG